MKKYLNNLREAYCINGLDDSIKKSILFKFKEKENRNIILS
jgi:hypothetical protein